MLHKMVLSKINFIVCLNKIKHLFIAFPQRIALGVILKLPFEGYQGCNFGFKINEKLWVTILNIVFMGDQSIGVGGYGLKSSNLR